MAVSRNGTLVDDAPYQQSLLTEPFYENGMSLSLSNSVLVNIKQADPFQATKMPWDLTPIFESLPVFSTALVSRRNGARISIALKETTRSLIL